MTQATWNRVIKPSMNVEEKPHPPVALAKNWITLIGSDQPDDVRRRAGEMLLTSFGDMESVLAFAKRHNLVDDKGRVLRTS
jgi:hypothetical protein